MRRGHQRRIALIGAGSGQLNSDIFEAYNQPKVAIGGHTLSPKHSPKKSHRDCILQFQSIRDRFNNEGRPNPPNAQRIIPHSLLQGNKLRTSLCVSVIPEPSKLLYPISATFRSKYQGELDNFIIKKLSPVNNERGNSKVSILSIKDTKNKNRSNSRDQTGFQLEPERISSNKHLQFNQSPLDKKGLVINRKRLTL